jgi:hypothetical protein
MTERPSRDERDAPRPEVSAFLHDRGASLDHEAAPVTADEATRRTIVDASKPRRQWAAGLRPSTVSVSRRSALAAAAAVALIVGGLGGFAIGRGSAPKHSTVATAAANAHKPDTAAPSTTAPGVVTKGSFATTSASGLGMGGPMTRLFDRMTSEGVAIHAFKQDQSAASVAPTFACPLTGATAPAGVATTPPASAGTNQPACPSNAWTPPPECYSTSLVVEAANQGAVGQTSSPSYPLHDVATITMPLRFGDSEGSPAVGYIVNTNDQVVKVEARWADGFVDSMAPNNGWAVVAHNGTSLDATVVALSSSGATLKTFATNGYGGYAQPPAECVPPPPAPPALPPAGAEQPDDPAAAKQAITNAYQTVFTHGSDATLNASFMEDPDSLTSALATTKSNFPQAVDTVTVKVGDIVFTSKTEAALYFELNYQGGAEFGQQIGYAKLIDGTWKISHDTMCMVLSWGGGQCSGGSGSSPGAPPATPLTTVPNN